PPRRLRPAPHRLAAEAPGPLRRAGGTSGMTAGTSADVRAWLRGLAIPIAGVVLCLLPSLGISAFWSRELMLIALLALSTSGMNLIFGYAGELALGQAAVYATGAYAAAILATSWTTDVVAGAAVGVCA